VGTPLVQTLKNQFDRSVLFQLGVLPPLLPRRLHLTSLILGALQFSAPDLLLTWNRHLRISFSNSSGPGSSFSNGRLLRYATGPPTMNAFTAVLVQVTVLILPVFSILELTEQTTLCLLGCYSDAVLPTSLLFCKRLLLSPCDFFLFPTNNFLILPLRHLFQLLLFQLHSLPVEAGSSTRDALRLHSLSAQEVTSPILLLTVSIRFFPPSDRILIPQ